MIVPDDVSDDGDNIDDGTECDEDYVEMRAGDSEGAEDTTLDGDCFNELEAADSYFHWKGQDKAG
jgi:hypothetical protein